MKLLITDDARAVHSFIEAMFTDLDGIELAHAYDGQELINLTQNEGPFDLILLDWEMPNVSGLEALIGIRKDGCNTPVVMVTSRNDVRNIAEALENGANEYIMKPFTKEILLEKIEMVLGRKVA